MARINDIEKQAVAQYCTFWLSNRLYGIDILDIKEVNSEKNFTQVFHAPGEIRGYVNIRGQVYLILDLRLFMGLKQQEPTGRSRLILFKPDVLESVGVLVDQVGEVVEVTEEQIDDRRKNEKNVSRDIMERRTQMDNSGGGVCKLENQLMVIVKAGSLVKEIKGKYK